MTMSQLLYIHASPQCQWLWSGGTHKSISSLSRLIFANALVWPSPFIVLTLTVDSTVNYVWHWIPQSKWNRSQLGGRQHSFKLDLSAILTMLRPNIHPSGRHHLYYDSAITLISLLIAVARNEKCRISPRHCCLCAALIQSTQCFS